LEAKLSASNHDKIDINSPLNKGINNLLKLDYIYEPADIEKETGNN
jgi:site-specific DNA recombinase